MRGDPHPGASPRAGTAGVLFPRSYSPTAETGSAPANRRAIICIKGVVMFRAPPPRRDRGRGARGPLGGSRCRYRGCSRGSGPAASLCAGLGAPRCPRGLPAPSLAPREGQSLGDPPLKVPGRDTLLSHQPGDRSKAKWGRGDKSQGGIIVLAGMVFEGSFSSDRLSATTARSTGWRGARHWAQLRVPPWMPPGDVPTPSQSPHRTSWEHLLPERHQLQQKLAGTRRPEKQNWETQCP